MLSGGPFFCGHSVFGKFMMYLNCNFRKLVCSFCLFEIIVVKFIKLQSAAVFVLQSQFFNSVSFCTLLVLFYFIFAVQFLLKPFPLIKYFQNKMFMCMRLCKTYCMQYSAVYRRCPLN